MNLPNHRQLDYQNRQKHYGRLDDASQHFIHTALIVQKTI